jgi:hypothetical protein
MHTLPNACAPPSIAPSPATWTANPCTTPNATLPPRSRHRRASAHQLRCCSSITLNPSRRRVTVRLPHTCATAHFAPAAHTLLGARRRIGASAAAHARLLKPLPAGHAALQTPIADTLSRLAAPRRTYPLPSGLLREPGARASRRRTTNQAPFLSAKERSSTLKSHLQSRPPAASCPRKALMLHSVSTVSCKRRDLMCDLCMGQRCTMQCISHTRSQDVCKQPSGQCMQP